MNFLSALRPVGRILFDTLLPPSCLACDAPVDADGQFCLQCFRKANFVSSPFCGRCGVPLPFGAAGGAAGFCAACEALAPAYGQARSALRYDAAARGLILPFKYADRTDLARGLAVLMARAGAGLLARADVLVPVPLHKARLKARRYNQAALLAAALGRLSGKPVMLDALARPKPTVALGKLSAVARREALAGAIAARRAVTGRVLLVDDVMTSGATADACATALLAAGAVRVDVLTAARVPDPRLS